MHKFSKGFTIIELIVVVAVIAVLAAIVLVSVTQYINKAKDAAAKGNLETMVKNGYIYFANNGNYLNWITSAGTGDPAYVYVYNALTRAGYTPTATCDVANCGTGTTAWCACIIEKANTSMNYCIDSKGDKIEELGEPCNTMCTAGGPSCMCSHCGKVW